MAVDDDGSTSKYDYLLLARHGQDEDLAPVEAVARRLVDTLGDLTAFPPPLKVTVVEHADTEPARRTAEIFAEALGLQAQTGELELGPERFPPVVTDKTATAVTEARAGIDTRIRQHGETMLIVGHEPAIDWLLSDWVDWGNEPLALASGELVCLARAAGSSAPWHLWWVITPDDASAIEPLRQKLASKMTEIGRAHV